MKKLNLSKNHKHPASLLSDECVPEIVNKFLESCKIKLLRVADSELISKPDEIIFKKANQLKLPIITLDIRFAGQVYKQQSYSNGLILLRYKGRVTDSLLFCIKKFLNEIKLRPNSKLHSSN